jgi:hypothetical protein
LTASWQNPDVTVEELERWECFGAVWRVVQLSPTRAVVDMCSCTGEPMERRESADPEVVGYVRSNRARVSGW